MGAWPAVSVIAEGAMMMMISFVLILFLCSREWVLFDVRIGPFISDISDYSQGVIGGREHNWLTRPPFSFPSWSVATMCRTRSTVSANHGQLLGQLAQGAEADQTAIKNTSLFSSTSEASSTYSVS